MAQVAAAAAVLMNDSTHCDRVPTATATLFMLVVQCRGGSLNRKGSGDIFCSSTVISDSCTAG